MLCNTRYLARFSRVCFSTLPKKTLHESFAAFQKLFDASPTHYAQLVELAEQARDAQDSHTAIQIFKNMLEIQKQHPFIAREDAKRKSYTVKVILKCLELAKDHRVVQLYDLIKVLRVSIPYVELICALVECDELAKAEKLFQELLPHLYTCCGIATKEHALPFASCNTCTHVMDAEKRAKHGINMVMMRNLVQAFAIRNETIVDELLGMLQMYKQQTNNMDVSLKFDQMEFAKGMEYVISAYLKACADRSIHAQQMSDCFSKVLSKFPEVVQYSLYHHNILLSAYSRHEDTKRVEMLYAQMKVLESKKLITFDESTFTALVNSCKKQLPENEKRLKSYLADMKQRNVKPQVKFLTTLLGVFITHGSTEHARVTLQSMLSDKIDPVAMSLGFKYLLSTLKSAPNAKLLVAQTMDVFQYIRQNRRELLSTQFYNTVLQAFAKEGLPEAVQIVDWMLTDMINLNDHTYIALITLFSKKGTEGETHALANELTNLLNKAIGGRKAPPLSLVSAFMKWLILHKDYERAKNLFTIVKSNPSMYTLDPIVYNAMLKACTLSEDYEAAWNLYEDMKLYNMMSQQNVQAMMNMFVLASNTALLHQETWQERMHQFYQEQEECILTQFNKSVIQRNFLSRLKINTKM